MENQNVKVLHVLSMLHKDRPYTTTPRFWVVPSSQYDIMLYSAMTDPEYDYSPYFYRPNHEKKSIPIGAIYFDVGFLEQRDVLFFVLSELSEVNRLTFLKIASDFVYVGYRLRRRMDDRACRSLSSEEDHYISINRILTEMWKSNRSVIETYFAYLRSYYNADVVDDFFYTLMVDQGAACRMILLREQMIIDKGTLLMN